MTGYPLVDAGMRQLRAEGWMHNRARMVTASFLVKDLGIDWREGRGTSSTSCWTATLPRTSATGSGSPGRASTRGRTASTTRLPS